MAFDGGGEIDPRLFKRIREELLLEHVHVSAGGAAARRDVQIQNHFDSKLLAFVQNLFDFRNTGVHPAEIFVGILIVVACMPFADQLPADEIGAPRPQIGQILLDGRLRVEATGRHDAAIEMLHFHTIRIDAFVFGRRHLREDFVRGGDGHFEIVEPDGSRAVLQAELDGSAFLADILRGDERCFDNMPVRRAEFAAAGVLPLTSGGDDECGLHFRAVPVVFRLGNVGEFDASRDDDRIVCVF